MGIRKMKLPLQYSRGLPDWLCMGS